jgi:transcriptional regulator with XRE-family HTH domain
LRKLSEYRERRQPILRVNQSDMEQLAQALGFRGGFYNAALRRAREGQGLKQSELATKVRERLGRGSSTLMSHFEVLRGFPDPEMALTIAEILGVPVEELFPKWLSEYRQARAVQDIPLRYISELTREEFAQIDDSQAAESIHLLDEVIEEIAAEQLPESVEGALDDDVFTERDVRIIELRFGIHGAELKSLEQAGAEVGVSPGRVYQLEAKALRKLRHPSRAWRFEGYLD